MKTVAVARNAMGTRFEIILHGDHEVSLRAAAEEALDEIDQWEALLSPYKPTSEVSRINALAGREPVRIGPQLFTLLQRCVAYTKLTQGTFDVTIAPLLAAWGFLGAKGAMPASEAVDSARAKVGMNGVELDEARSTVRFVKPGMRLDFGSIGKGYAVDCAVGLLRDAGISSALINGGTSTVYAIGTPPDEAAWKVAIAHPETTNAPEGSAPPVLAVVALKDEALSVSAVWGKAFESEGKVYGHVLDPRTGWPVAGAALSAVILPSAADTDVFTTALLTLGATGQSWLKSMRPQAKSLLLLREGEICRLETNQIAASNQESPETQVAELSASDEAIVEARLAAYRADPHSYVSLEEMIKRLRNLTN